MTRQIIRPILRKLGLWPLASGGYVSSGNHKPNAGVVHDRLRRAEQAVVDAGRGDPDPSGIDMDSVRDRMRLFDEGVKYDGSPFIPADNILEIDGAWVSGYVMGIPVRHVDREDATSYRDRRAAKPKDHPFSAPYGQHPASKIATAADPYAAVADYLKNAPKTDKPAAFMRQVGGDHYSKHPLQPFQFSLRNGWDGAAHTILKYVHRHADKGGVQDLEKALHVVEIRLAEMPENRDAIWMRCTPTPWSVPAPTMGEYIRVNAVPQPEADALRQLATWVDYPCDIEEQAIKLKLAIEQVIYDRYKGPPMPKR